MKNILIVGGSKGIGNAILLQQLEKNKEFQDMQIGLFESDDW